MTKALVINASGHPLNAKAIEKLARMEDIEPVVVDIFRHLEEKDHAHLRDVALGMVQEAEGMAVANGLGYFNRDFEIYLLLPGFSPLAVFLVDALKLVLTEVRGYEKDAPLFHIVILRPKGTPPLWLPEHIYSVYE